MKWNLPSATLKNYVNIEIPELRNPTLDDLCKFVTRI
jgi:hypothetical protein